MSIYTSSLIRKETTIPHLLTLLLVLWLDLVLSLVQRLSGWRSDEDLVDFSET